MYVFNKGRQKDYSDEFNDMDDLWICKLLAAISDKINVLIIWEFIFYVVF